MQSFSGSDGLTTGQHPLSSVLPVPDMATASEPLEHDGTKLDVGAHDLIARVQNAIDTVTQSIEGEARIAKRTRWQCAVGGLVLSLTGIGTTAVFWYYLAATDLKYGPTGLSQMDPALVVAIALATSLVGGLLMCFGARLR